MPTIGIAKPASSAGKVVVTATGKLAHSMLLFDSKTNTCLVSILNEKYKKSHTLDSIRKLCGAKANQSIHCMVLINVELLSHRPNVECRVRNGWGSASVPLFRNTTLDTWTKKRQLESEPETGLVPMPNNEGSDPAASLVDESVQPSQEGTAEDSDTGAERAAKVSRVDDLPATVNDEAQYLVCYCGVCVFYFC